MAFKDPEGVEQAEARAHQELVDLVGDERADDPPPRLEWTFRADDIAIILNENKRLRAKVDELQERGSKLVYRIQDQAYQLAELKKVGMKVSVAAMDSDVPPQRKELFETLKRDQGILTGNAIKLARDEGSIQINPFNPNHLNPASYDLTLGRFVRTYKRGVNIDPASSKLDGTQLWPSVLEAFDVRERMETDVHSMGDDGFLLRPGIGYLMHTVERIRTDRFVPVIDGKSSLGRLFMKVHETAGYGEPGFDGQYTLEVTVQHPLRVYAGMRIAQIRFHTLVGQIVQYDGHYQGEYSTGPVASRAYTQFEK